MKEGAQDVCDSESGLTKPTAASFSAHQEHLAGALDGAVQAPLIVRGQASVFAREDTTLVGDKLLEQIDVLEIQSVGGEINFGLGPRRAHLGH